MTLAEAQELFHEAVTSAAPLAPERLRSCFAGTAGLPAEERVAIYARMVLWRLADALRETFPNLARHLGDERFAAKCQRRMEEIRRAGKTIILVSHAMDAVTQMADRCCLLVKGRLEEDGEPAKVIERYRELLHLQDR